MGHRFWCGSALSSSKQKVENRMTTGADTMSSVVQRFWTDFLRHADDPKDAQARWYDVARVGNSDASADEGARLILSGHKTATSSLLWKYEASGEKPPAEGDLSILLNGRGEPVCVFETVSLAVRPFDQIDEQFARDYGEWGPTLETWRKASWAYYADECRTLNRVPSLDMPLVCERIRVVFPSAK